MSAPALSRARMIEPGIGYVRISRFNESAPGQLRVAVDELRDEGLDSLVIDLRGCAVGGLPPALQVAGQFLARGEEVVTIRGRRETQSTTHQSRGVTDPDTDMPLALLVDRGTAGVAEVLAAALQDHERALLVGERTNGDGAVLSALTMADGSVIRLTTAYYQAPGGEKLRGAAREPDLVVTASAEDEIARSEAQQPGAALNEFLAADPQLRSAVEALNAVRNAAVEPEPPAGG